MNLTLRQIFLYCHDLESPNAVQLSPLLHPEAPGVISIRKSSEALVKQDMRTYGFPFIDTATLQEATCLQPPPEDR